MKTEPKTRSKHEYSTFALFFLFFLLIGGAAIATAGIGVDGSIQFNDAGVINGTPDFTYNKTTGAIINDLPNSYFEISEFQAFPSYYITIINGTDSLGNSAFAFYDNIFAFDSGGDAGGAQIYLYQTASSDFALINLENNKLQIDGSFDNITTSLGKSFIVSKLITQGNTEGNLTNGDINASIVYADALIYKSPKFNCDAHTKICEISVIGRDTSIEVQFDDNFNPLSITHKDTTYTPQQFNQQVCNANSNNREDCDRIIDKWQRLSCERNDANVYLNGECYTNPYYACEQTLDKVWNLETNSCVFDAQKVCESQGDLWNGTDCNAYVPPAKTTEEIQEECLNNKATIWFNGACISLEAYYQ